MLELIFQGFIEWLYGLIMECWEYFSSALLDIAGMDFAYLRQRMPVIDDIMQLMLALGWALLIGNLVFQAVRAMLSGIGFDGENPKLLFARTFVFAFLLLASPQICALCLDMTSTAMDIMQLPQAAEIRFADEASFPGLASSWLLVIVCGIIVILQSLKLICELAERYFILATLTVTAPLAFGVGGSRSTSDIFTGWCRMYGSMCLLMVLSAVFVKMLLSILSFYPSGLDVLPWMVLVIAVVKVAKKADSIITRIGLNPAITGEPLAPRRSHIYGDAHGHSKHPQGGRRFGRRPQERTDVFRLTRRRNEKLGFFHRSSRSRSARRRAKPQLTAYGRQGF